MSTGLQEDAALVALLKDSEVSEDIDPLGLSSWIGGIVSPLWMLPKGEPGERWQRTNQ